MNKNVESQIATIYNRQKEVNIGLRNVNCLSCAHEPEKNGYYGKDGRLYKGLLNKKPDTGSDDKNNEEQNEQSRRLLNMKWDHLGL